MEKDDWLVALALSLHPFESQHLRLVYHFWVLGYFADHL
jgi:hypothetical protein